MPKVRNTIAGFSAIWLLFVIGVLTVVSLWTDRSLDYWVSYIKGVETDVPWWLAAVLTILLNGVILLLNVLTELARLVL